VTVLENDGPTVVSDGGTLVLSDGGVSGTVGGTVLVVDVLFVDSGSDRGERPVERFGPDEPQAPSGIRSATTTMRRAPCVNTDTYATERMHPRPHVRSAPFAALVAIVMVAVLAGCGGSAHRTGPAATSSRAPVATRPPTVTGAAVTSTTVPPATVPPTTSSRPVPTTVAATVPPTTPPTTPPTAAPLLVTRLNGVGNAGQVIAVSASGYGATTATFTAYQRTATGWQQVFGPWLAHIGRNGFAPSGAKHEGDGRTPSGSYGLSFFFGVRANPGVKFEYRMVGGPWIVWDDDPASANYNKWIDNRVDSAGASPEPMYVSGVYDYGAVIAYNTARVAGLGSAIFLHVSSGGTTAGCVSLPASQLVSVLQWLDPQRSPRIVMGTLADITE
jgi:L,D-peptidoglycan transpeptidase YkuD (ErfK/YbiS/YcfS/YnhG family)